MKDVLLLADLHAKDLFPGDFKAKVKAIYVPTATEAADYFLSNKIEKDLIIGNKANLKTSKIPYSVPQ